MASVQRRSKRIAEHEAEIVVVEKDVKPVKAAKVAKVVKPAAKKPKMTAIKTANGAKASTKAKTAVKTAVKASKAVAKPVAKAAAAKPAPAKSAVAVLAEERQSRAQSQRENPVVISEELEVGDVFPPGVTVTTQDGARVDLSALIKTGGNVVIFAYPKASTPGCTRQVAGFKANYKRLTAAGGGVTTILGLSGDSVKAQKRFHEKQGLPYRLISDEDRQLIELLGVGKEPRGVVRSHVVFRGGRLVLKAVKVSPEASFNGVAEFLLA